MNKYLDIQVQSFNLHLIEMQIEMNWNVDNVPIF